MNKLSEAVVSEEIVYVPSSKDVLGYVPLAYSAQGRLLRKKILPMNESFIHPANPKTKIFVDKSVAESLVRNFNSKMVEHVQLPMVDSNNAHTEDVTANLGEVLGVTYDDKGVYAIIDARKHAEDFGKTILNSSATIHMNYTDTKTGDKVGPTLLNVSPTNRGHVRDMGTYEDFKDVIAASAAIKNSEDILFMELSEDVDHDNADKVIEETLNKAEPVVVEPVKVPNEEKETSSMTKEEAIAFLKENEGIDVEALQGDSDRAAELSAQLDTVNEQLALSGEKINDVEDLANAVVALTNSNKGLEDAVDQLKLSNQTYAKRDAENEVDGLIRVGKVLPAQKDVMVKLSMTDRETFDALVPENPIVKLSEDGVTLHEEPNHARYDADIERYKKLAASLTRPNN